MSRKHVSRLCLAAVLASATPLAAQDGCENRRELTATLDAAGVNLARLEAGAGSLRVIGRPGLTELRVTGTACGSRADEVDAIRIITERRGTEAFIATDIPQRRGFFGGSQPQLDLTLEVPARLALELTDGSGSIEITGTQAALEIHDGSGGLTIRDTRGDVRISDGSGSIDVENVQGGVTIDNDGSGSITLTDVTGSALVREDGSGSIRVRRIGGDFTVDKDGSGSIDHRDVAGTVRIPSRR